VIAREISQKGAEALIAEETPLQRQWEFLTAVKNEEKDDHPLGIPAATPGDAELRKLTAMILKGMKGDGGAARLLSLCDINEMPPTITAFLSEIYQQYPKPKRKPVPPDEPDGHEYDWLDNLRPE